MRLGCVAGAHGHADQNALGARIHAHPQRVSGGPVDLVPQRLNLLRDFYRFAAGEKIQAGAVRDGRPVFAGVHAVHRRRAHGARDFGDGPVGGLVDAVVLRGMNRVLLDEVELAAQHECGAHGLAVIFGDGEQAVDAVVAFRIVDA